MCTVTTSRYTSRGVKLTLFFEKMTSLLYPDAIKVDTSLFFVEKPLKVHSFFLKVVRFSSVSV